MICLHFFWSYWRDLVCLPRPGTMPRDPWLQHVQWGWTKSRKKRTSRQENIKRPRSTLECMENASQRLNAPSTPLGSEVETSNFHAKRATFRNPGQRCVPTCITLNANAENKTGRLGACLINNPDTKNVGSRACFAQRGSCATVRIFTRG